MMVMDPIDMGNDTSNNIDHNQNLKLRKIDKAKWSSELLWIIRQINAKY